MAGGGKCYKTAEKTDIFFFFFLPLPAACSIAAAAAAVLQKVTDKNTANVLPRTLHAAPSGNNKKTSRNFRKRCVARWRSSSSNPLLIHSTSTARICQLYDIIVNLPSRILTVRYSNIVKRRFSFSGKKNLILASRRMRTVDFVQRTDGMNSSYFLTAQTCLP